MKHGTTVAVRKPESKHGPSADILAEVCRVEVHAHTGSEHSRVNGPLILVLIGGIFGRLVLRNLTHYDAIVIGAGPNGLAAAVELARWGLV